MSSASQREETNLPAWWLAEANSDPTGPVSTDVLVEWVRAGRVPVGAFVCRVGDVGWRRIGDVAPFGDVVRSSPPLRFDRSCERCVIDLQPLPPDPEEACELRTPFDSSSEDTAVAVPRPRVSRF